MVHFWNLAFTFMIITAVVGNTAVLWIVIRKNFYFIFIVTNLSVLDIVDHRRMRTITNLFIFNLSLTDLINTLFNSTFNFVFMKNK